MNDEIVTVFLGGKPGADPRRVRASRLQAAAEDGYFPDPGVADAAVRGFTGGVTFGFDDEAAGVGAGLGQALGERLHGIAPENREGFAGGYAAGRDERRAAGDMASTAHPGVYTLASLGGSVATAPLAFGLGGAARGGSFVTGLTPKLQRAADAASKFARTGATGAAAGTLQGLGDSRADTAEGVIEDTLQGGALGLAIGGGAGALINKVKNTPLLGKTSAQIAEMADEAQLLALEGANPSGRMLKSVEGALRKGDPPVRGGQHAAAEVLRRGGVVPWLGTTRGNVERLRGVLDEAEQARLAMLEDVTAAGERASAQDVALNLRTRAADLLNESMAYKGLNRSLMRDADELVSRYPQGISAQDAQGEIAGWSRMRPTSKATPGSSRQIEESAEMIHALRGAQDDLAEATYANGRPMPVEVNAAPKVFAGEIPQSGKDAYQQIRTAVQVAMKGIDAGENALGKKGQGASIKLSDLLALTATGGGPKGVAAVAALKAVRGVWDAVSPNVKANALDRAARVARFIEEHPRVVNTINMPEGVRELMVVGAQRGAQDLALAGLALDEESTQYKNLADRLQNVGYGDDE